jgi:hypothetical protein
MALLIKCLISPAIYLLVGALLAVFILYEKQLVYYFFYKSLIFTLREHIFLYSETIISLFLILIMNI